MSGRVRTDVFPAPNRGFIHLNYAHILCRQKSRNNGVIVFAWLETDDPSCLRFVESLHRIGDSAVTDAVLRLLFTNFENIHIEPQWWEALSNSRREALMGRFNSSIDSLEPWVPLTDDGLAFDTWPVLKRQFVGFQL